MDHSTRTWEPDANGHRAKAPTLKGIGERTLLVAVCVAITTAAALLYLQAVPKVYQAEADLQLAPVAPDPAYVGLGLISTTTDPTSASLTASRFVTVPSVASIVVAQLHLADSPEGVLTKIKATPVAQSNIIAITADSGSPVQAQALANTFAAATIGDRTNTLHQRLDALLPQLSRQIAAAGPNQNSAPGSLLQRYYALSVLRSGPDPTLQVQAPADLPTSPVWPRRLLTLAAAVVAGLVLGLCAVFILSARERRLRYDKDFPPSLASLADQPPKIRVPPVEPTERPPPSRPSYFGGTSGHSERP